MVDFASRVVSRFLKWDLNQDAWAEPTLWLFVSVEIILCVCTCGWGEFIGYVVRHQDWICEVVALHAHLTQDIYPDTDSKWSRILDS